eukprot:jgi/Mesen1/7162/ME000037S06522
MSALRLSCNIFVETACNIKLHLVPAQGASKVSKCSNGVLYRHSMLHERKKLKKGVFFASTRAAASDIKVEEQEANSKDRELELACPICYETLSRTGPSGIHKDALAQTRLRCVRCQRPFSTGGGVANMTLGGGQDSFEERQLPGTSIFQNPAVAFVYERGWRQGFALFGFPGVDEEFRLAQEYLRPALGGPLLDISCGSGLFTRRFVASGDYPLVIAADFSESMLQQCQEFLREDKALDWRKVALVRADVARLPFTTGSLAGVHAGAAIHCWPQPASAVAEISRVLQAGGMLVGSTFLLPQAPVADFLLDPLRQLMVEGPVDPYRYWTEEELRSICESCGLVNFTCTRNRGFILFAAMKPGKPGA